MTFFSERIYLPNFYLYFFVSDSCLTSQDLLITLFSIDSYIEISS